MRSSALRVGIAWVVVAVMAAPAWGTLASAVAVLGMPAACPMRAARHCPESRPSASSNCCLVDWRMPASNVPASVAPAPSPRSVPALGPALPAFDAADVSHRAAFVEARAPLKAPGPPTYLSVSALRV